MPFGHYVGRNVCGCVVGPYGDDDIDSGLKRQILILSVPTRKSI